MPAYPAHSFRFLPIALLALTAGACEPDNPSLTDAAVTRLDDAANIDDSDAGVASDAASAVDAITPEPDAYVVPDAGEATVLFSRDIRPILDAQCTGSGCHGTAQTFFLGSGAGCRSAPFVVPFDPDASFVVAKLEGTMGAGCGLRMPRGRTPLTATQLTTIRTWISEGARDN